MFDINLMKNSPNFPSMYDIRTMSGLKVTNLNLGTSSITGIVDDHIVEWSYRGYRLDAQGNEITDPNPYCLNMVAKPALPEVSSGTPMPKVKPLANFHQEGGDHYKKRPIQPWDYIIANNLGFLEGNVIKYVTRHKDKNGLEDLKKARHYLDKLIEVLEND